MTHSFATPAGEGSQPIIVLAAHLDFAIVDIPALGGVFSMRRLHMLRNGVLSRGLRPFMAVVARSSPPMAMLSILPLMAPTAAPLLFGGVRGGAGARAGGLRLAIRLREFAVFNLIHFNI